MSDGQANVLLQNLRDFTVQIHHAKTDAIVGTGVVISTDQIVTCAHVVAAAGVNPRLDKRIPSHWELILGRKPETDSAEVGVYFAQARGGETKARRATVAASFPQHEDDVVVLKLVGGPAPLGPEQFAVLGMAEGSDGHGFRSYGYRRVEDYIAGYAYGTIYGLVESPPGHDVQAEPVQLKSNEINRGMSGSAVLDVERNLIVGIVAETWYPDKTGKDQDTAWAVNARVLTFNPMNLPVRAEPWPRRPAQQPRTDLAAARAAAAPSPGIAWNNAPPSLAEWVGRDELLKSITKDWLDVNRRVTGLIGFGGEGKSSLARKWVDTLLTSPPLSKTGEGLGVGVFWWGFYEKPNADEFFEAALKYMSGGRIDPRDYPSSNAKAHLIAGLLSAGRYVFVLDGLEVMQHQDGDEYGLLRSNDLREFLTYFAAPGHSSFCLVTSRAPLIDLMAYTTCIHRDVDRLIEDDGRALLRKIGVKGSDAALDKVVSDWDGHALTLSLLGGLLVDQYGGDVSHIGDMPLPTEDKSRHERVHRVLRRYDEHLSEAEQAFLTLFSAFRTPVGEAAFDKVFRAKVEEEEGQPRGLPLQASIAALDDTAFNEMVERLVRYRILRRDPKTRQYTAHPLIRNHYFARLTAGDRAQTQAAHERIKDYYLAAAGDTPQYPMLDDLRPLIEVVHHACRAGAHDEASEITYQRIYQGYPRRALVNEIGAWETAVTLMLEFFLNGDASQEPQVSGPKAKSWILNEVGLCLMSLGRLREAAPFYERHNSIKLDLQDWRNASRGYTNLAELYAHLGDLAASADAAREALELAQRAKDKRDERQSMAHQAWAEHLRGNPEKANKIFQEAGVMEREIYPNLHYLFSNRGIFHADHLRRIGDADYARRVAEANVKICDDSHWPDELSRSHRVLGDLDADTGQHGSAREHYNEALRIARGISFRPSLIEALLARGRWHARDMQDAGAAFSDLNEALGYAVQGGYRRYEADIRVGLAWAHLAALPSPALGGRAPFASLQGGFARAGGEGRAEAERALTMSREMGYHWGIVDAEEVLRRIKDEG